MRAAGARSGVASSMHYDDRDRLLRETANKQAEEAIWKLSPRRLLDAEAYAASKGVDVGNVNPEGEVVFRIRSPRGFSIGYKMKKAVRAMDGSIIEDGVFRLIEFESDITHQFGEFITADPEQIKRLRREDCKLRGVVEWAAIQAEHLLQEGEEAAQKMKANPEFLSGLFAGLRKLGINPEETFAGLLKPKRQKQDEQGEKSQAS